MDYRVTLEINGERLTMSGKALNQAEAIERAVNRAVQTQRLTMDDEVSVVSVEEEDVSNLEVWSFLFVIFSVGALVGAGITYWLMS